MIKGWKICSRMKDENVFDVLGIEDKDGHYVIIKVSILQEDIAIITIHIPNIRRPKYTK